MRHLTPIQTIKISQATFCIAFSPDGKSLAVGSSANYGSGSLLFYFLNPTDSIMTINSIITEQQNISLAQQTTHPKSTHELKLEQSVSATALYFTPDKKYLWVVINGNDLSKGSVLRFDLSNERLTNPVPFNISTIEHNYIDGFVHIEEHLYICGHSMTGDTCKNLHIIDIKSEKSLNDTRNPTHNTNNRLLLINDLLITPSNDHSNPSLHFFTLLDDKQKQQGAGEFSDKVDSSVYFKQSELTHNITVEHTILCMVQQQSNSSMFITGNTKGEFHHWWFNGQWQHLSIEADKLSNIATELQLETLPHGNDRRVIAIQYLPNNQGWLSLQANGLLVYWHEHVILDYLHIAQDGTPRCLAIHPTMPLIVIGLKQHKNEGANGIVVFDINQWLEDTKSIRQNLFDAQNAPDDKLYFTPRAGLPPQPVRGQLSLLTNVALGVNNNLYDKIELQALLADLQLEPYFVSSMIFENKEHQLKIFEQQLQYDLSSTCDWWEENWRYDKSWPIISAILNNNPLPIAIPSQSLAECRHNNYPYIITSNDNKFRLFILKAWAFIKKHW
jgi:hypothetical protein